MCNWDYKLDAYVESQSNDWFYSLVFCNYKFLVEVIEITASKYEHALKHHLIYLVCRVSTSVSNWDFISTNLKAQIQFAKHDPIYSLDMRNHK